MKKIILLLLTAISFSFAANYIDYDIERNDLSYQIDPNTGKCIYREPSHRAAYMNALVKGEWWIEAKPYVLPSKTDRIIFIEALHKNRQVFLVFTRTYSGCNEALRVISSYN